MKNSKVVKRYATCAVFCIAVLLGGIVLSLASSTEVNFIGGKPSFLFSLLFLITLLFILVMTAYQSYTAWFDSIRARERLGLAAQVLAKRFGPFRFLVITNVSFLLWYSRIVYPIIALISFGVFMLFLLGAF